MSKGKDEFGDRMKMYEFKETGERFIPLLPILLRLDGKNFSAFTKGFQRPFDPRMIDLMKRTTQFMVDQTNALIGYTQSDEISLLLFSDSFKSQVFFDGRKFKLFSVPAGLASSFFTRYLPHYITERAEHVIAFDCRAWQLPNKTEAVNAILWREQDATKNSVSMAAQHYYSHKQLHGLGRADMMDLLFEKGVNWHKYPTHFKRGSYFQRRRVERAFTIEEIERLPEMHEARTNPDLRIIRTEIRELELPPLAKVINREEVVFEGADPITEGKWADGKAAD